MKFKRLFIMSISALCLLTSCNISNSSSQAGNGKTKLNIAQSDLIAEFTGNKDYINKDYLNKVSQLDDNDQVGIIVTLDKNGLMDSYMRDNKGFESVGDYAQSDYGRFEEKRMELEQGRVVDKLIKQGLIDAPKHSYTTLMNGFSTRTTYGNYKKLESMGIASRVSLQEVYSLPQTKSVEEGSSNDVVTNVVDVYDTGIFNSSGIGYDGENTAVAILDSGFDVHHQVFKNMPKKPMISKDDVALALPDMVASSYKEGLKVEDVYLNTKIPFAYDYADKDEDVAPFESSHGTHVAGIIAGKDDRITGVAINTQLVLMKVFADVGNGAVDEDIIAALEDSILLGVDAINLSLGTACGFTTTAKDPLRNIYEKIENSGISLIVAASNDYNSAYGGEQGNSPMTANPDSSAVGSPSTFNSSLAVASIAGVKSRYIKTASGHNFFFNEANGKGASDYDFYEMLDLLPGVDTEIEYVTVPGVGATVNYSGLDVRGKIALVKRGGISFEEKAQYAYEAGARGVILYNNVGGDILMNAGSHLRIPYCSISKDDGEELSQYKSGKLIFNTDYLAGPFMSEFSSWGPSPDLRLKPEITAHGGEILSSVPGGGYDKISGTSMASPNMCGIVVLIRQVLKDRGITDPIELKTMTNQILMSTATIANDQYGNPYSPRKQGSGLGNLKNAINTKAYITVDGIDKTKVELGDDPKKTGVYELKFNIVNMSASPVEYRISNKTMTESVQKADNRFIAERAHMLKPDAVARVEGKGSLNGDVITVEANSKATVSYKLTINEADKKYMRQSFKNGIYVEGFATLDAIAADGVDLSVPFLAFFGDWTKAPLFDKTIFEVETEKYNGAIDEEDKLKADYYATQPLGRYYTDFIIPMGTYIYDIDTTRYEMIPATEEHCAIGYDDTNINGIMTIYAGLLRNAKRVTSTITNAQTGEVIYEHINLDQLKAHFSGQVIPSFDMIEVLARDLKLENNVKYTFRMEAELDYGDGGKANNERNSFEFSFYCDTAKPIITNAEIYAKYDRSKKKNRYYIDLYVYDNHYTQSIRPFGLIDGNVNILSETPIPSYGDRDSETKISFEVTDYMDLLQYNTSNKDSGGMPLTNGLGILIDDYALNQNFYFLTLPGTNATAIDFVDEAGEPLDTLTIYEGEEFDVTKYIKTNDPLFDNNKEGQEDFLARMNYKSSNEDIFKVKNGKLLGIKSSPKRAYLTVSTVANDGMYYEKTIQVVVLKNTKAINSYKVEATEPTLNRKPKEGNTAYANNKVSIKELDFTYFDTVKAFPDGPAYSKIGKPGDKNFVTNQPTIEFYPSEQVRLHYELKPYNIDPSRLEFIWSSSNKLVATVDDEGLVTAESEGVATITLAVKIDGKLSNVKAKIRLKVNSEFIIQNRFLAGYKGKGGEVVIPDDKGILGISSYAFSLYTLDTSIDVEEENPDGNKLPGSNNEVTSVIIPSDVSEIGKFAFYNCTALRSVKILSKPNDDKIDTVKVIREFAFDGCTSLEEINLGYVTVIGEAAFRNCSSLKALDFSNIYALGSRAFQNCTGLTELDLTKLRNAGAEVFKGCTGLKTIKTGEFTKFSEGMFEGSGLESLVFYSDRIPARAFKDCVSLRSVEIINDIIYVGDEAFSGTKALETVAINKGCDFIYRNAFKNSAVKEVKLPNSVVDIEFGAFSDTPNLVALVFQADTVLNKLSSDLFNGNTKLEFNTEESLHYLYKNHILYNKDETVIILAAPSFNEVSLTIPASITEIYASAFNSNLTLESVTLHDNLIVGDFAFASCPSLKEVLKGANASYGKGVFAMNPSLDSFEGLEGMAEIAPYMFAKTGFTALSLHALKINEGAFLGLENLVSLEGDAKIIGAYAFAFTNRLVSINLPSLEELGEFAFHQALELKSITANKLVTVGKGAFNECRSLQVVNLPLAEVIGDLAFANCSELESVTLPEALRIGAYAFSTKDDTVKRANRLSSISLPSVEVIGAYAFRRNTALREFTTASAVKEIGEYAFSECTLLNKVNIPNASLAEIKAGTFYEDTILESFVSNPVKKIGDAAFYKNTALKTIDLSEVVEIGMNAFVEAEGLTNLNLNKLVKAGVSAFQLAVNVETINIPVIEEISESAFLGINASSVVLPKSLRSVGAMAFDANASLKGFTMDGNKATGKLNDNIILDEGVLYSVLPNGKLLLSSYPTGKPALEYKVLDNTVRIELAAADGNRYLNKVILPDTLKLIGNLAFYGCVSLNEVEFLSQKAPTLEETRLDVNIGYPEDSEMIKLLYKYFPLNPADNLYYGQFVDFVGVRKPLKVTLPNLPRIYGYDNIIYSIYFDMKNASKSEAASRDTETNDFLDKIKLVPTGEITLRDEKVIRDARNSYNKLKQDLKSFGYTEGDIEGMLNTIKNAEDKLYTLKREKVYADYGDLINEIQALGSYSYDKINQYRDLYKQFEQVSEEERKYIDKDVIDGFNKFKSDYDKYFKDIYEDIEQMETITELPTISVGVKALACVSATAGILGLIQVLALAFKRFLI